ncbi:general substrate transporter [Microdochium trichocladiopsis]|uniref:General substrate transporter n=1 Tax=Microdochium trichocladiopsis TaxID=1682393 RepID=A0A9P8XXP7_9PEZI|nr:general substrate transporter [Microdochium trichocladiopsis]KAH7024500.1 general substrate transporter [Microdochium trichocladiopsis]
MIPDEREPLLPSQPHANGSPAHAHDFVIRARLEQHLSLFHEAIATLSTTPDHRSDEPSSSKGASLWSQPRTLYLAVTATALGAIGQGWAQTSMNGANLTFPAALGLDSSSSSGSSNSTHDSLVIGLINSAIYLSNGILGAWLATPLNHRLGRNAAVFCAAGVSLLSNLAAAAAPTWQVLLAARLVLGCALGVISTTLNIYTAECAPAGIRGGLGVSWQLSCAFGIFLGFVANVALYGVGPVSWRLQLAASGLPMIPLLPLILWVPQSPAWLVKNDEGRYDRAFNALRRLRRTDLEAARELFLAYQAQQQHNNKQLNPEAITRATTATTTAQTQTGTQAKRPASTAARLIELVTVPRIRHATLAAHTVMIGQQLCGINIISFYSTSIFTSASFTPLAALLASCVFGLLNFLFAFPAVWTMDSFGRRSLLLCTLPMMGLCMLFAGVSFSLPPGNAGGGGGHHVDGSVMASMTTTAAVSARFVLLASMVYLFCIAYSPGMGPVPAAYSAEVFPLSHRDIGMSSAVSATNVWAAALSASFPWLVGVAGEGKVFGLYAVLNVVAWVLVWAFVRETRRKTLEELDEVFEPSVGEFVRAETRRIVDAVKMMLGRARTR